MPLYEYEITSGSTGETLAVVTLPLPVASRDGIQIRRRTVPSTVGIAGAAANPAAPQKQVLAAYQRLEQRIGNNAEFRRRIGHAPETVKRAWA
jgi:hypothetical protein